MVDLWGGDWTLGYAFGLFSALAEAGLLVICSQAAAVEGDLHRQRSARYLTQLWSQGRNCWHGEVRVTDRELVEDLTDLAVLVVPLLAVRRLPRGQVGILHRRLLAIVRDDDVCQRLMTVPGVGLVVALAYRATALGIR